MIRRLRLHLTDHNLRTLSRKPKLTESEWSSLDRMAVYWKRETGRDWVNTDLTR